MTQEHAILFLLRQGPQTCSDFIRSEFHLAASYRRAITMLRHQGYVITLRRGRQLSPTVRLPDQYVLDAEPTRPGAAPPVRVEPSGQGCCA